MNVKEEAEKSLTAILQRIQGEAENADASTLDLLAKSAESIAHVLMDV